MARTKFTERSKHIRVSTVHHPIYIKKKKKSFNFSPEINVAKLRRFYPISKNSVTSEHNVIDEINEAHRNRPITYSANRSYNSIKQSNKKNKIEPLPAKKLEITQSDMNTTENEESTETEPVNVIKIFHQQSQEQMESNTPTTIKTDTDTDTISSRTDSLLTDETQHNAENQNTIFNDFGYNNSTNSINPILITSSNYWNSTSAIDFINEKNAYSKQIETIPSRESHGQLRENDEKRKAKRKRQRKQQQQPPQRPQPQPQPQQRPQPRRRQRPQQRRRQQQQQQVSTTTTPVYCGQSCLTQSWIDSSGGLALWPFDGSYVDTIGGYDPISSLDLPTFDTGYVGQAALFNASAQQAIYTSFIPLNNVSFTVEAWLKPTGYPNSRDHSIVGLCLSITNDSCLHINIRYQKLYLGFYDDDAQGGTTILVNQWIHTAFVFDETINVQTIYLNGFQDGQHTNSSVLLVDAGNFTIGTNELISTPTNYYQGYIDQLSISQRAQSSCEILERATLAAHFKFDIASPYIDSGPNTVATTSSSTSIITGCKNTSISFLGSSSSYFQTWGFTSLGINNQAFSITLWIKPQTLSGTLVHLSTSSLGTGSACFPLLGFASNGVIVAQVLTVNGSIVTATGPVLPVSSSWIPIVQTWSSSNGLRLYVNNTLISSVAAATFLGSGTTPNYLTLGNCLSGCGVCSNGVVSVAGPFVGAIDDWRIYSRELTASDVCALYFGV